MEIKFEQGEGRPFVLVYDDVAYETMALGAARTIAERALAMAVKSPVLNVNNWETLASEFEALLKGRSFRQVSLIGFAAGAVLAQHLALTAQKFVRTMVLVDGTARAHPTCLERLAAWCERRLPLGLPLRSQAQGFDSSPYLQRIRIPSLLVVTSQATSYQLKQAQFLARRLPTAWQARLAAGNQALELGRLVANFQDVPARCPQ
jgi:pimeloyl-ACP methyl ester carboxylesterase